MDATWQEVEKEIALLGCLIRRLPDDEKADAACRIAVEAVLWGGSTFYESVGILEEAKIQFQETWEEVHAEDEEEDSDGD